MITGDRVKWNEVAPAPIFFWYDFARAPSARTKKGLGILLTATMILVLALLLYGFWEWLWHITTFLALALLVYLAWPWLSQIRWDDAVMSWLQQIRLPQVSATNTSGGRPYVLPQRTYESRIHFEELGQAKYPRPYPEPSLCAEDRAGKDVFLWKGRRWYLPHNEEPYRYLCVPNKRLEWCWPIPPNASAVPCRSDTGSGDGWCWRGAVSYSNDS